jgi:signal transduction histidine kinase
MSERTPLVRGRSLARGLPPFRATLGVKLALVLLTAVAGALAIVYLMVVPRLEQRLVDARIAELRDAETLVVREIVTATGVVSLRDRIVRLDERLDARVVVYDRLPGGHLRPFLDSQSSTYAEGVADDPAAREAARTFSVASGRIERDDREFAEVAFPVGSEVVILLSSHLGDVLADVRLVSRSLLIAGLVALLASAAAAYVAALGLTRRLRRLEAAAEGMAAGDFDAPIETRGSDEVAELARGFDAMRIRLADLDRVRREFIANASHELRTPLFSLGGFLELLADEELDEQTRREFIAETRTQVERLTRLATDLLDLSRLDAGQLQVREGRADLAAAARTVAEEFRAVAEATAHPLRVEADGAVEVAGDHERVLQIGRILVENAIRHTPSGTPIEVAAARADGRATLAVRDEGPGVPPAEQGEIFQRFYRASGGKAFGSGLGLAIASELAQRMGGELTVRSQPGDTVFTLDLPAGDAAFPRENGAPDAVEADSPVEALRG